MKNRLVLTLVAFFVSDAAFAQVESRNTLTEAQATQMQRLLGTSAPDSVRFKIQIRLAKYIVENGFTEKAGIDSLASLVSTAKKIDRSKLNHYQIGVDLLYEAALERLKGNQDSSRLITADAIRLFNASSNYFPMMEGYLQLLLTYEKDPVQVTIAKQHLDSVFAIVADRIPASQLDSCMATLRNFYLFSMYAFKPEVRQYYLDEFGRSCKVLNYADRALWAKREAAYMGYQQGQLQQAIDEILKVLDEQKQNNLPEISSTYHRLGFYYYIATDYQKSMFYSLEATKNIRTATDSTFLPDIYDMVSVNYRQRGDINEAVEWTLKSLDYMDMTGNYTTLYSTLPGLLRDMLPLDRAREALKILEEKSKKRKPASNWEKSALYTCFAQVLEALRDYTSAYKYAELLQELVDDPKNQNNFSGDDIVRANQFLAAFFLNRGEYERSEKCFRQALSRWPQGAQTQGREYEHRFQYRLDSAKGDYRSAFAHFKTWHMILDSSLSVMKAKQFDEIQTAFKTEQKDSLINLKEQNIQLLTKQDQLQKTELRQGSMIRNVSLAAALLLIVTLVLLFNRYNLKKRANEKLEIKQGEIEKQNNILLRLVDEKDWLVKEIHHRVKNNLQIIMSLLNSQSAYIDNSYALTAIQDSQHRVQAMSLIHQKLYGSDNVSSVDLSIYIRELATYLSDSFDMGRRIRFDFDIEPVNMDVSQAVPLGLILNEAITNALKYAFPGGRYGNIKISISSTEPSEYKLIISDDGIGMPNNYNGKKPNSLGMSLMQGLTEDLNGIFRLEKRKGTTIEIVFASKETIAHS